jgi:hypothetical protein
MTLAKIARHTKTKLTTAEKAYDMQSVYDAEYCHVSPVIRLSVCGATFGSADCTENRRPHVCRHQCAGKPPRSLPVSQRRLAWVRIAGGASTLPPSLNCRGDAQRIMAAAGARHGSYWTWWREWPRNPLLRTSSPLMMY